MPKNKTISHYSSVEEKQKRRTDSKFEKTNREVEREREREREREKRQTKTRTETKPTTTTAKKPAVQKTFLPSVADVEKSVGADPRKAPPLPATFDTRNLGQLPQETIKKDVQKETWGDDNEWNKENDPAGLHKPFTWETVKNVTPLAASIASLAIGVGELTALGNFGKKLATNNGLSTKTVSEAAAGKI